MDSQTGMAKNQWFEKNWAQWIMETAYRWEDLSDVIKLTGIDMIDNDHRILTEYAIEFNRLFDIAGDSGFDLAFINAMEKLFAQLFGFTRAHFEREQDLIERLGIPGIGKQRFEHKRILTMLEDYMAEIQSGRLNIALKFKSSFMEWLADHINLIDYETFRADKIGPIVFSKARVWEDTADLIRSMGFSQVDDDHRVMTEYMLELDEFSRSNVSNILKEVRDPVIEILEKLREFADLHFQKEEKTIAKYHLKNLKTQKLEHKRFLTILNDHISNFLESDTLPSLENLKIDILGWWVNHINQIDYSSFKEENWVINILSKARNWEDISELVLSIGIDSIDNQHKKQTEHILGLKSLLERYEKQRDDQEIFEQIVLQSEQIYRYAEKHFEHEEEIMQKMKIPDLASHMTEHMALLDKIQKYIENVKAGRMLVSIKLKTLFADWWINHINNTDYKSFRSD